MAANDGELIAGHGRTLAAGGANPTDVKRGIDRAAIAAVTALRAAARVVDGQSDIVRMGTVSANGESDIGTQIAEAMEQDGQDGVITVKENPGLATETEIVRGMRFDNGYLSLHFVTDPERSAMVFEDSFVLLGDAKLSSLQPLVPILEAVNQSGRALLIIADDVEGEARPRSPHCDPVR